MPTHLIRTLLHKWHPWWTKKKVNSWGDKQLLAVYHSCLAEDEDKVFDKYCKRAFASKDIEFQAEIMCAFQDRFN